MLEHLYLIVNYEGKINGSGIINGRQYNLIRYNFDGSIGGRDFIIFSIGHLSGSANTVTIDTESDMVKSCYTSDGQFYNNRRGDEC